MDCLPCLWGIWALQPQKLARGLKYRIQEEAQLIWAFVFAYSKSSFSYDASHIYYIPALKKLGFTGFTLSVILSFSLLVCHSVIIQFLYNILRMNRQSETKFCIHIIINKVYIGIVNCCFSQICNSVMTLDSCQNLVFMPPTSKKLRRHIGLGLSICPSICVLHLHSFKNR